MSFFKSFLGAIMAKTIQENKKEDERVAEWNRLFDMAMDMQTEFSDYLSEIGVGDTYVMPPASDLADEGISAINAEKRKLENFKRKINEFISLGGHPSNIWYIEKIDEYITKLKYMISIGYLEQQDDWLQTDMDMLKSLLDMDVKAKEIMQKATAEEDKRQQREIFIESIGLDVDNLSGVEFENVCQALVEKMGFTTQTTKASGDGGIDLIAYNHQPLLSGKYIIQCKRYTGSVGEPIIRDLYGVIMSERANKGILMTTGHFTKSAISFAEGKPIELIDGQKLKSLLTKYSICDETVLENDIPIKEIFESNIMLEDMYDDYIDTIKTLSLTNDEKERAKFINQLLEWTLSECADINDFNHKLVIFKEIKNQIVQYIEKPREAKSKYLAYLYQMVYVQLSILQGNFKDAVIMFSSLMANEELQFTFEETFEPQKTKVLMEKHSAVFCCMYYTYYDMCQLAALLNDEDLADDLSDGENYYGYQTKSLTRINGSIEYFKRQGEGREKYWLGELEAHNNMKKIHCLYFMSDYEPKMYFNYSYNCGSVSNIALDRHSISLEEDILVVEKLGAIENIRSKIRNYKRT